MRDVAMAARARLGWSRAGFVARSSEKGAMLSAHGQTVPVLAGNGGTYSTDKMATLSLVY
jgi:hypothetical protein